MARKETSTNEQAALIPSWKTLIGMNHLLSEFNVLWRERHVPSVILFEGREGIGKRSVAAAISAVPFCQQKSACGVCDSCKAVLSQKHQEILWIETEEQVLKLSDADLIHDHLSFLSSSSLAHTTSTNDSFEIPRIVVIIDADKLNIQAANRLLLVLEEPPSGSFIFMTSSRPRALLPTILSRSFKWPIAPPHVEETLIFLRQILKNTPQEEVPATININAMSDETLKRTIIRSALSPGKALRISQRSEQVTSLVNHLLSPENMLNVLSTAEIIAKTRDVPLTDWIEEIEIQLNETYKKYLHVDMKKDMPSHRKDALISPPKKILRRKLLSEAKNLGVNKKISLNQQLFFESIGLTGLEK